MVGAAAVGWLSAWARLYLQKKHPKLIKASAAFVTEDLPVGGALTFFAFFTVGPGFWLFLSGVRLWDANDQRSLPTLLGGLALMETFAVFVGWFLRAPERDEHVRKWQQVRAAVSEWPEDPALHFRLAKHGILDWDGMLNQARTDLALREYLSRFGLTQGLDLPQQGPPSLHGNLPPEVLAVMREWGITKAEIAETQNQLAAKGVTATRVRFTADEYFLTVVPASKTEPGGPVPLEEDRASGEPLTKGSNHVLFVDGRQVTRREFRREAKTGGHLDRDYLSAADASRTLRISPGVLRRARERGMIRSVQVGRRWYYLREDLATLIKQL